VRAQVEFPTCSDRSGTRRGSSPFIYSCNNLLWLLTLWLAMYSRFITRIWCGWRGRTISTGVSGQTEGAEKNNSR
jgi:hypothetical protein